MTVAAIVGLAQTIACPGPAADYGPPAWLYHRCFRARGFFSIYMTLAGVLSLVLLATLPRLLPGAALSRWPTLPWLVSLVGLAGHLYTGRLDGIRRRCAGAAPHDPQGAMACCLAVSSLLGVAALAGPSQLRQRFLTMGDLRDPTVTERVYMWRSGLTLWRQPPGARGGARRGQA